MEHLSNVKFSKRTANDFYDTLNKRINQYFETKHIQRKGNWKLLLKSIIMFAIFIVPYILILSLDIPSWLMLIMCVVIGIGMAGVGMNVMHDGNHGAYSKHNWVNKMMGSSMYILAGNVYNWQVQHNVLHHTFTNVEGLDEDLEAGIVIRFSKNAKWYWFHSYQQYYSIFLYSLLTFNWALFSDYKRTYHYLKRGLAYGKKPNQFLQWTTLIVGKMVYLSMWIVLPILLIDAPWWYVLIGFAVMHGTAGIILSIIFQLAHVVDDAEMPLPDVQGNLENSWAVHQLFTTVNFSPKSWFLNWFTGGLNRQIEHHIFPHISHIHYKEIAVLVKMTAKEYDLPYHEYRSFTKAVRAHFKYLGELGVKPSYR